MARLEDLIGAAIEWTVVATAVNGVATATKAAVPNRTHYIVGASISGSAAPAAAVVATVNDGGTAVDTVQVAAVAFSPIVLTFNRPLRCTPGNLASVSLPALGAGVTGTVVIKGFTRA